NAEKKPRYSPKPAFAYAKTPESSSGLRIARSWKTKASMSMPVPAIVHAMSAPRTPVSRANLPGRVNTPAPTIEPTTMPIRARVDSFTVGAVPESAAAVSSVAILGAFSRPTVDPSETFQRTPHGLSSLRFRTKDLAHDLRRSGRRHRALPHRSARATL